MNLPVHILPFIVFSYTRLLRFVWITYNQAISINSLHFFQIVCAFQNKVGFGILTFTKKCDERFN